MAMSNTLKNMKFMQRALPKEKKIEEIKEEEQPIADGNFNPPSNVKRKCMVILEGDPQPMTRGRISFQNFNPLIDKLKEEAANGHHAEASTSSLFQSGRSNERSDRKKKQSEHTNMDMDSEEGSGELKRKQPKDFCETSHPKKLKKQSQGNTQPSSSENRNFHKQPKRDKLDFNVLVPQKSQGKKKGR